MLIQAERNTINRLLREGRIGAEGSASEVADAYLASLVKTT